jgi:predicted DNA-binding transcriptional regulator YafY
MPEHDEFVRPAREAIRRQHKMRIHYKDESGSCSERIVWPFALAFYEGRRLLAAWCEMRKANRHFRIDRIAQAVALAERYPTPRHELLKVWREENAITEDS